MTKEGFLWQAPCCPRTARRITGTFGVMGFTGLDEKKGLDGLTGRSFQLNGSLYEVFCH